MSFNNFSSEVLWNLHGLSHIVLKKKGGVGNEHLVVFMCQGGWNPHLNWFVNQIMRTSIDHDTINGNDFLKKHLFNKDITK